MTHTAKWFALSALLALFGCVHDPASVSPVIPTASAKGVYILNEGNFGRSNSTLSYYDLGSFSVYNDVFYAVNGKNLGDVGTSMVLHGGCGYVVVNNSHKIEIIDLQTNLNIGTISFVAGESPWEMAFVNDTLALVTDLYGAAALVVDLKRRAVVSSIPVGNNAQGIGIAGGKAFAANSGFGSGTTVSVIDLATLSVRNTIRVADNPVAVHSTPGGMVYVLCAGFYGDFLTHAGETPARITVLDPLRETVVDSIFIGGHASSIAIGSDGRGYVPTTDSVLVLDTRMHRVIGTFLRGNYYGVGVEDLSGDVYLADPRNYTLPGIIRVYASTGQRRTEFEVGLIPAKFAFKR